MHAISKVCIIDDFAVATLSDWSEVALAIEVRGDDLFYKIRKDNKIIPVGSKWSWCYFTWLTRWGYG